MEHAFMLRLESSSVSPVFKYRDRVTIILDILTTVRNSGKGRRKTQIMQSANLNYTQANKYLRYLSNQGFITIMERSKYFITDKGSKFLQLAEIQKMQVLR